MIDELKHNWNVECVVWCKFDKLYDGCQDLLLRVNVEVNSIKDEHKIFTALIELLDSEDCVYEKEWLAEIRIVDTEATCMTQFEKSIDFYYEKNTVKVMSQDLRDYEWRELGVGTSVDTSWKVYKKRGRWVEYDKAEQERRYEKYLYANSGIELETTQ